MLDALTPSQAVALQYGYFLSGGSAVTSLAELTAALATAEGKQQPYWTKHGHGGAVRLRLVFRLRSRLALRFPLGRDHCLHAAP